MDKFFIKFLVIVCYIGCIPACTPQLNPISTSTPKLIFSPTPTNLLIPSSTPTSQPTNTPIPQIISNDPYFNGWPYADPFLVWGAQLREKMNGNCQGFICDGKDLRVYDPEEWQFLGRGEYGKSVFTFNEPLDTFVITHSGRMGIDAISGITVDGKTVTYGFLVNGALTASYMDGSNFQMRTVIDLENKYMPVETPCGIIDPNPDGDKSFNITLREGGIVWNFLDRPFKSAFVTRKGYSLKALTIVTESISKITSDQICP